MCVCVFSCMCLFVCFFLSLVAISWIRSTASIARQTTRPWSGAPWWAGSVERKKVKNWRKRRKNIAMKHRIKHFVFYSNNKIHTLTNNIIYFDEDHFTKQQKKIILSKNCFSRLNWDDKIRLIESFHFVPNSFDERKIQFIQELV